MDAPAAFEDAEDRGLAARAASALAPDARGPEVAFIDLDLAAVTDAGDELMGYRLCTPDASRRSRLYLSREDALDAWINRSIEWED